MAMPRHQSLSIPAVQAKKTQTISADSLFDAL
jgi:hypothetical protein